MNFNIDQHDRILIVGENGSGKTTLLRAILKTIPVEKIQVITPYSDELTEIPQNQRLVTVSEDDCVAGFKYALKKGNCMLVVDDVDNYIDRFMNEPEFRSLLIQNRHRGLGYIFICRRISDMPPLVIMNTSIFFVFQTDYWTDKETFRKNFPEGSVEKIVNLNYDKHEYFYFKRKNPRSVGVGVVKVENQESQV